MEQQKQRPKKKPLSLWPLTVEEAAEAFIRVPPMPKEKTVEDNKSPKAEGEERRAIIP
jgi:hypothetical protein